MSDNVSKSSRIKITDANHARSEIGKGSAWMITMRWVVRLIGVFSTIILARLLTPEDFGVVAIAMLIISLIELFADAGITLAVIRHTEDSRELYDSAWTLSIIIGALLTVVILLASPLTIEFFEEPRSFWIILVLAFRPLITGFQNIGILTFRKELNFRKDFKFGVIRKLSFFVPTIIAAVVLQSYWALVIGTITGGVITVAASYWMHPFRPRISFSYVHELLAFSVHLLSQNVMRFICLRFDEFVVGGIAGTEKMGLYYVAVDVGSAPTAELVLPISRSLTPIYAKIKDNAENLRSTYLSTLSMISTLAFSASVGVALVAEEIVSLVLGEQWDAAAGIMVWISLAAAAYAIVDSANHLLNPIGKEAVATKLGFAVIVLLIPSIIFAGMQGTVEDIAATRFVVFAVMAPISLIVVGRQLHIGPIEFAKVLWRPALGASLMAGALIFIDERLQVPLFFDLLISVTVGVIVYGSVVTAAWILVGRPVAFETTAIELAREIGSRIMKRKPHQQ